MIKEDSSENNQPHMVDGGPLTDHSPKGVTVLQTQWICWRRVSGSHSTLHPSAVWALGTLSCAGAVERAEAWNASSVPQTLGKGGPGRDSESAETASRGQERAGESTGDTSNSNKIETSFPKMLISGRRQGPRNPSDARMPSMTKKKKKWVRVLPSTLSHWKILYAWLYVSTLRVLSHLNIPITQCHK